MIGFNHQGGLIGPPATAAHAGTEALRERERLRRELLRRIVIRETKRRATRGCPRLP